MEHEKGNIDDKIFRFIYIEAMRDAVIQLAYKGKKRHLWTLEEEMNSLKGIIERLIDKVLNDEYLSQEEYDEDFLKTTISVCNYINDKEKNDEFTFGNAQKLINIMLKYLFISTYKDNSSRQKFDYCHCPMDQQLLKEVWSKRKKLPDNITLEKREVFLDGWGKEDFEKDENGEKRLPKRYLSFQESVRYLVELEKKDKEKKNPSENPLEYDYDKW